MFHWIHLLGERIVKELLLVEPFFQLELLCTGSCCTGTALHGNMLRWDHIKMCASVTYSMDCHNKGINNYINPSVIFALFIHWSRWYCDLITFHSIIIIIILLLLITILIIIINYDNDNYNYKIRIKSHFNKFVYKFVGFMRK